MSLIFIYLFLLLSVKCICCNETKVSSDSIALTELVEASALPYVGIQVAELSLDEKAEVLFAGQL